MANEYAVNAEDMTTVANAIRAKGGTSGELLFPDGFAAAVEAIKTTPTLQNKTVTPTTSQQSVTADSGYDGLDTVTVEAMPTATQATPSISVSSSGLITASAEQSAGYVASGTKSATKQLSTKGAATITPGTSNQTIASGLYLTGAQTIKGDANLKAANIASGVSIFGVAGSLAAGSQVVRGTVNSSGSYLNITINPGFQVEKFLMYALDSSGFPAILDYANGSGKFITVGYAELPLTVTKTDTSISVSTSTAVGVSGKTFTYIAAS